MKELLKVTSVLYSAMKTNAGNEVDILISLDEHGCAPGCHRRLTFAFE